MDAAKTREFDDRPVAWYFDRLDRGYLAIRSDIIDKRYTIRIRAGGDWIYQYRTSLSHQRIKTSPLATIHEW